MSVASLPVPTSAYRFTCSCRYGYWYSSKFIVVPGLLTRTLAQFPTQPMVVCYDSHQCNEGDRSKRLVVEEMPECPRGYGESGSRDDQKESIFHAGRFSAADVLSHSRRAQDRFEV